jgi:hypothetical protein
MRIRSGPGIAVPGIAVVAAVLGASACGGDDGGGGNPSRLYLAPLGSETSVQLVPDEPDPF